jgi:adenylate cyclase
MNEEPDVAETLRALGLPEEAVRRAVERGVPEDAIFDSILLPEISERTVSAAEVADGGPSLELVKMFWEAFGLPVEDEHEPAFTEEEAAIFRRLHEMQEIWPPEIGLQVARVYGRLLARIAQTEVQLFRVYIEPRLRSGSDPHAALAATRDAFAELLPVTGPLLLGVHRRWLEHHIAQEVVREAEEETTARLPGSVSVCFLFCDLKDFTAFVSDRGDEAGVAAIDRFAEVISRERGPTVRFTKGLGDGYMLVYADVATALDVGRRVIAAMQDPELPSVHASAHAGMAIAREGDYFGSAVNLAARLLDAAGGGELVATATTAQDDPGHGWEPAGSLRVRGVTDPVPIVRLDVHRSIDRPSPGLGAA